MTQDRIFKPPDGTPEQGGEKRKYVQINRPQVEETIKKARAAHEHKPGGSPTAYCAECHKRCEDCNMNCVGTGIEWRYE